MTAQVLGYATGDGYRGFTGGCVQAHEDAVRQLAWNCTVKTQAGEQHGMGWQCMALSGRQCRSLHAVQSDAGPRSSRLRVAEADGGERMALQIRLAEFEGTHLEMVIRKPTPIQA